MKKMDAFILIVVLVLTACASQVPLTVPDQLDDVVVASFSFAMEELSLPEDVDTGEFDIVTIVRAKQVYEEIKESLKDTLNPPPGKVYLDSVYFTIVNGLKSGLDLPIQSREQCKNDIQHDPYGLPVDDVRSVARSGKFDAAMDISVDITFPTKETSGGSVFGVGETKVKGKPKLTLKVKMIDKSGKMIWRDGAAVASKEWVVIDEKWLWGIRYKEDVAGPTMIELTSKAVKRLVDKNTRL